MQFFQPRAIQLNGKLLFALLAVVCSLGFAAGHPVAPIETAKIELVVTHKTQEHNQSVVGTKKNFNSTSHSYTNISSSQSRLADLCYRNHKLRSTIVRVTLQKTIPTSDEDEILRA